MPTTDAILIGLILFAIIIVIVLIAQPTPHRIKIAIDTLLGKLNLETEGQTEDQPPPDASRRSHIKTGDIDSQRDTLVRSQRGDRDLETGHITSGQDTTIFDERVPPDSDPNPEPPA